MLMGIFEYLWVLWVSMGFYGFLDVYGYLWVLYLNIKNIAYFLIQDLQKI